MEMHQQNGQTVQLPAIPVLLQDLGYALVLSHAVVKPLKKKHALKYHVNVGQIGQHGQIARNRVAPG